MHWIFPRKSSAIEQSSCSLLLNAAYDFDYDGTTNKHLYLYGLLSNSVILIKVLFNEFHWKQKSGFILKSQFPVVLALNLTLQSPLTFALEPSGSF